MLSIITPVYNGDLFIESCIQNVINQGCTDIEHIIVDGGSTDRTVEIIDSYAKKYPHIRWVSEQDRGQSDAMNKGINLAKGDILGILNADDFYEGNIFNKITEIFKILPEPTFFVGNCNVWDDQSKLLYVSKPSHISFLNIFLDINQFPVNPSAYFYHTSLHYLVGGYDVNEHYVMDLDFVLRAIQVAKIRYIDKTFGNFRLIEGTKTMHAQAKGEVEDRVFQVLEKYRKKMSFFEQICLQILSIQSKTKKFFLLKQRFLDYGFQSFKINDRK